MSKYLKLRLFTLLLMVLITESVSFAADTDFEYKLKALYISRLPTFTHWPESAKHNTFKICIDATDKVAQQLKMLKLAEILDMQVEIIAPPADLSISQCNILYISQGKVSSALRNIPVLTLSSQAGFAEQGGMIEFYIDQSKVRMKANLYTVNESGIKLSSKLLRLLKIVKQQGEAND